MGTRLASDNPIASAFGQVISEQFSPAKVLYRLLLSKFRIARVRLTKDEREKLLSLSEAALRTSDFSSLTSLPIFRKRRSDISIHIDVSDVSQAIQKHLKIIEDVVPKTLKKVAKLTFKDYQRYAEIGRVNHCRKIGQFKDRLARTYGKAFRSFERFLISCINTNESFLSDLSTKGGIRQTAKRLALIRLHHRACRVSMEIENLLKAGLGDGAMGRWRTLHEICVCAVFISQSPNDVARRFLRHEQVERSKLERLSKRLAGEEQTDINEFVSSLRTTYGKGFTEDYGWASKVMGVDRVKFSNLEEATEFGHARLEYLKANNAVHASSLALQYRPSLDLLTEPGDPMEWAMGGNLGLSGPATLCAWSLLNTTLALLKTNLSADNVVLMMVLSDAKHLLDKEFVRADRRIKKRHGELTKHQIVP